MEDESGVQLPTAQEKHDYYSAWENAHLKSMKEAGLIMNCKQISDGYYTFQELYDMRLALTRGLFKKATDIAFYERKDNPIWVSKQHSDGTMFDGMFIVGWTMWDGKMITFHYHLEHWEKFQFANWLDKAPEWDGHTDKDVIERLLTL